MELSELIKIGRSQRPNLARVKVAVIGDTSTQFLVMALRGALVARGLNPELFEADYDQICLQTMNPDSGLYAAAPEYIVVYQSAEKFARALYAEEPDERGSIAARRLTEIAALLNRLSSAPERKIIIFNYVEINDRVFGNYSNSVAASLPHQLRLLNLGLSEMAASTNNLFILDLAAEQAHIGRKQFFDSRQYFTSANALSIAATAPIAMRCADIIGASKGLFIKCVILDLDNTLWGGAIGDDGMENIELGELGLGRAYGDFQRWLKQLRERGIILAVCSKNNEENARRPFELHPDMVLRLEDIAVFVANWESKAENIRQIQQTLNISFSSMVFLDDNPVERNVVSSELPEVTVPELPQDPTRYLEFLQGLNLFETVSFTHDDVVRTAQYQAEARRAEVKTSSFTGKDFLESLEMIAAVEEFTDFNRPRVAQLIQRSNQFNLRTLRYSGAEIANMVGDPSRINLAFSLSDKFGDYGLISIIMLLKQSEDEYFIDNWIMSCRVLGRGMENFVLNAAAHAAREAGSKQLRGEYVATSKNEIVKEHYKNLGFKNQGGQWVLDLETFDPTVVEIH